jgi:hypothetical protein
LLEQNSQGFPPSGTVSPSMKDRTASKVSNKYA